MDAEFLKRFEYYFNDASWFEIKSNLEPSKSKRAMGRVVYRSLQLAVPDRCFNVEIWTFEADDEEIYFRWVVMEQAGHFVLDGIALSYPDVKDDLTKHFPKAIFEDNAKHE